MKNDGLKVSVRRKYDGSPEVASYMPAIYSNVQKACTATLHFEIPLNDLMQVPKHFFN